MPHVHFHIIPKYDDEYSSGDVRITYCLNCQTLRFVHQRHTYRHRALRYAPEGDTHNYTRVHHRTHNPLVSPWRVLSIKLLPDPLTMLLHLFVGMQSIWVLLSIFEYCHRHLKRTNICMCGCKGLGVGAGWRAGPDAKDSVNPEMAKKIRDILQPNFDYWNTDTVWFQCGYIHKILRIFHGDLRSELESRDVGIHFVTQMQFLFII